MCWRHCPHAVDPVKHKRNCGSEVHAADHTRKRRLAQLEPRVLKDAELDLLPASDKHLDVDDLAERVAKKVRLTLATGDAVRSPATAKPQTAPQTSLTKADVDAVVRIIVREEIRTMVDEQLLPRIAELQEKVKDMAKMYKSETFRMLCASKGFAPLADGQTQP